MRIFSQPMQIAIERTMQFTWRWATVGSRSALVYMTNDKPRYKNPDSAEP